MDLQCLASVCPCLHLRPLLYCSRVSFISFPPQTHPLLLCRCLSQRLPSPPLHIPPSWTTCLFTCTLASSYLCWCLQKALGNRHSPIQLAALGRCRGYQPEPRSLSRLCMKSINILMGWELGAHDTWEVVQSKFLGGQARHLPVPTEFSTAAAWAGRCFPAETAAPGRPPLPLLCSWFTPSWGP